MVAEYEEAGAGGSLFKRRGQAGVGGKGQHGSVACTRGGGQGENADWFWNMSRQGRGSSWVGFYSSGVQARNLQHGQYTQIAHLDLCGAPCWGRAMLPQTPCCMLTACLHDVFPCPPSVPPPKYSADTPHAHNAHSHASTAPACTAVLSPAEHESHRHRDVPGAVHAHRQSRGRPIGRRRPACRDRRCSRSCCCRRRRNGLRG